MGLCKCPKKKVTNLFCFEHRVNVCEYCLVEGHTNCVVQSYLSWLTDSDYDTNCSLCSTPLTDKETVRLQCLHLFHWECLDAWARRFPANTAPAGYRCYLCREAIFPTPNQTSPAIEKLRVTLQKANWARAGLGLSLLPELDNIPPSRTVASDSLHSQQQYSQLPGQQAVIHSSDGAASSARSSTPATVLDVGDVYTSRDHQSHFTSRKPMGINEGDGFADTNPFISHGRKRDEDLPENKYKRRSASEWLERWFRSRYGGGGGRSILDSRSGYKRKFFILFIGIVLIMTVFTVLTRMLSVPADDDPAFNPLANPNVRIAAVHDPQ